MAVSALFIPTAAALSKRLRSHCKLLARDIIFKRNRSPEIVLAFMVNIPWMAPGKHWADDETCSYMASALTIAMDISMNKLIVPSPSESLAGIHESKPPSECITARKALDIDGFQDVEPLSQLGRRLLRRRERIWLALFVLDRGYVWPWMVEQANIGLEYALQEDEVLRFQSPRQLKIVTTGINPQTQTSGMVLL